MPENSSCSSAGSCTKSSCEGCPSHNGGPQSFLVEQNKFSNIKHVIGVVSGKGGVGKSFVTSSLAVNMAKKMNVPILGIVENMSYLECPDCGKHINVFGESHTEQVAEEYGLKLLAQIPIDPKIAQMVDGGQVEYIEMPWFEEAVKAVENL